MFLRAAQSLLAVVLVGCATPVAAPSTAGFSATVIATPSTTPMPSRDASTGPSRSTPSPAAASPTTAPASGLVFTQKPWDGTVVAVSVDERGWVAVGASEDGAPTAWTSADAVTWMSHHVPDPNPELREESGFVGSVMGPLATWAGTWFSFGTVVGCCDGRGVLAWRSSDGQAWEVIESRSPLFTDGYFVQQLVAHEVGLVAREIGYPLYSSRVWTWTPDDSWLASDLGAFSDESRQVLLSDLAWDGARFVVVGGPFRGDYDAPPTGGVWVSTDGRHWETVEVPAMSTAGLGSVAALPDGGFYVIGHEDGAPVAWASFDGRTWEARSLPTDAGLGPTDVFEAGNALVALAFGDDRTVAWLSRDGISWGAPSSLPPLDGTGMVAGDGAAVVLIGRERTPDGTGAMLLFRASLAD